MYSFLLAPTRRWASAPSYGRSTSLYHPGLTLQLECGDET